MLLEGETIMHFEFFTKITEQDYLDFNYFHALESAQGKKQVMKSRIALLVFYVLLLSAVILLAGWKTYTVWYIFVVLVGALLHVLLLKHSMKRNIKRGIENMKKSGKLPYDEESKLEFFDSMFVEISPVNRTEHKYQAVERVCVVKDRLVLIYTSSVQAYVIPALQLRQQVNMDEFLSFLTLKCGMIEYY